jgi:hypothetical protein
MTIAPLSPSPITASVRRRYFTGDGDPPPTATVSATFDRQNADRSRQNHPSDPAHGDQNQRHGDYPAVVRVRKPKDHGTHRP